jgi:sulfatase maturation enzyme AslB (radical SAM superfamily)
MTLQRNICLRCGKEYVKIDGQVDFYICSECVIKRPHRLGSLIPQIFELLSMIGEVYNAQYVEINIDNLFLRIQKIMSQGKNNGY